MLVNVAMITLLEHNQICYKISKNSSEFSLNLKPVSTSISIKKSYTIFFQLDATPNPGKGSSFYIKFIDMRHFSGRKGALIKQLRVRTLTDKWERKVNTVLDLAARGTAVVKKTNIVLIQNWPKWQG